MTKKTRTNVASAEVMSSIRPLGRSLMILVGRSGGMLCQEGSNVVPRRTKQGGTGGFIYPLFQTILSR